jgi:hypothetical protein
VLIYLNNFLNFLKVVSETFHPNLEFGTLCIQNETPFRSPSRQFLHQYGFWLVSHINTQFMSQISICLFLVFIIFHLFFVMNDVLCCWRKSLSWMSSFPPCRAGSRACTPAASTGTSVLSSTLSLFTPTLTYRTAWVFFYFIFYLVFISYFFLIFCIFNLHFSFTQTARFP